VRAGGVSDIDELLLQNERLKVQVRASGKIGILDGSEELVEVYQAFFVAASGITIGSFEQLLDGLISLVRVNVFHNHAKFFYVNAEAVLVKSIEQSFDVLARVMIVILVMHEWE